MRVSTHLNKSALALCIAELFASFSYIGVLSILMLLFSGKLHLPNSISYHMIGNIIPVTLIAGLGGGVIGYRYLPLQLAALIGLISYTIGYFLLMKYGSIVFQSVGFAFLAAGFGLFEPNVRILFGNNYKQCTNVERDVLFIKFHVFGVVGQLCGILVLTYVITISANSIFFIAGIFSLIATLFYIFRYNEIKQLDYSFDKTRKPMDIPFGIAVTVLMILSAFYIVLQYYVPYLFSVVFVILIAFISEKFSSDTRESRIRIYSIFIFFIAVFIAQISIRQSFGVIEIFTQHYISNTIFSYAVNLDNIKNFEPLSIVVLFPLVIFFVKKMRVFPKNLMPSNYILTGLLFLAAAFFTLMVSMSFLKNVGISAWWLVFFYMLMGIGELFILPIVVARVYSFSNDSWKGVMMGLYYLVLGFSSYFSNWIGQAYVENVSDYNAHIYKNFFLCASIIVAIFAIILFFLLMWWTNKNREFLE